MACMDSPYMDCQTFEEWKGFREGYKGVRGICERSLRHAVYGLLRKERRTLLWLFDQSRRAQAVKEVN